MPYTRKSRIFEVWRHPVGRDLLLLCARTHGRSDAWPEGRFIAARPIASLDKIAGPEFTDLLLEAVNAAGEVPQLEKNMSDTPAWWKQAVAYRIYLPSFMDSDHDGVGDIAGVTQRLPYLEALGVGVLWLSPLQNAPGAAPLANYTAIQPEYGVLQDVDTLLEAAHSRSMRVVLQLDMAAGQETLEHALQFWQKRGIDGFSLVNVNLLGKPEGEFWPPVPGQPLRTLRGLLCPPAVHASAKKVAAALGDGVFLAGEVPLASPLMAHLFTAPARGELDMLVETGHLQRVALPGEVNTLELEELKKYLLTWATASEGQLWLPLVLQTADVPRIVSRLGANPVYRSTLAKMLATMVFTLRGTPMVFQGEELGLGNTRFGSVAEMRDERAVALYTEARIHAGEKQALEAALARTADHARTPFPWSAGPSGGFTGAQPWLRCCDGIEHLNANQQMQDKTSVWSHFQKLISLRANTPVLVYGEVKPVFQRNKRVFCYFRVLENEKWYVEMNLTAREIPHPGRILNNMHLQISNYETAARTLRPFEANVYRCE